MFVSCVLVYTFLTTHVKGIIYEMRMMCSSSVRLLFVGLNAKIFNIPSCDGIKLKNILSYEYLLDQNSGAMLRT